MNTFKMVIGLFGLFGILLVYLIVRVVKEDKRYDESLTRESFWKNFSSPYNKVVNIYLELLQHVSKMNAQDISSEETYFSLLKLGLGFSSEEKHKKELRPSFWFSTKETYMICFIWLLLYWLNDLFHFI